MKLSLSRHAAPQSTLTLFAAAVLLLLNASAPAQTQTMTAAQAWVTIQHHYQSALAPDTVDTLKAGDPATVVTGITTTFLDTMGVLRESVRRGNNLIITHEPTFYNHRDATKAFTDDPIYREKLAYIEQHHLVVYRLHDAIHADPAGDHILAGLKQALGWEQYPHASGPRGPYFITIPPTTLEQLARFLQSRLNIQTLRVEGKPGLPITHVALLPGSSGLDRQVLALSQPQVDVLIAGEASEWETVEYVRDAVTQDRSKALILLGHEVSEEPGMEQCAKELREVFPALKVDHIMAGQPLWNPDHPPTK
jgi:putative NIF3 family GTP cyclohydrolase 1 type 2